MQALPKTCITKRCAFCLLCAVSVTSVVLLDYSKSTYFVQKSKLFSYQYTTQEINDDVSCENLIKGDWKELVKANDKVKKSFRRAYLPEVYPYLTSNCSSYIKARGYFNFTVSKEEALFPLAFSLIVFKHAEQTENLLRAIWRPQNLYCIHIDQKATPNFKMAVKSFSRCFNNVFVHPISLNVRHATYTVLEPELLCLHLLWKKGKNWKYFINLTGQEFPLKTNYELTRILKSYNGSNDVEGTFKGADLRRWKRAGKPPHNIRPTKGSVHVAVTRDYVDFLLHNNVSLDLLNWVKKTKVPDETYFATLNYNPHLKVPGSYTGKIDDGINGFAWVRHKIWHDRRRCSGKFVRTICIFSVGDLPRLTESKALFANKFHYEYHHLAYDCLQSWYNEKVLKERQGHLDFNTSLYSQRSIVTHHI